MELGTISESQYLLNTEQILYVYECPGLSESFHSSTAFEEMRRREKILKDKTNITIAATLWTTKWSAVLSKNSSETQFQHKRQREAPSIKTMKAICKT